MGIPRAVQEQNSVMGAANRLLSKISNRIFISWEGTLPETDPSRTILTGNPVRAELLVNHEQNRRSDEFRVLIFGGSAGAASINRSMINAAHELRQISDRIRIRHQTGEVLAEEVKKAYDSAGLKAETHKFITDMSSAYDWADLVICRGGAGAMAEISVKGKPAIVIPYPYAVGDHQAQNASTLARHGAIRVIRDSDLKDQSLAALIIELAHAPEKLKGMAEASRTMGRPDAAEKIAKELMKMTRSPN
jgi:UDP-N-acetylglucosamine--N-acetylmuramyl-(pentapeptide) pyrophosphoryl-undecaprenol N-acetylglucosamine transferase